MMATGLQTRLKFSLTTKFLLVPKPRNSFCSVPCIWTQSLGSQGSWHLRFVRTGLTPLLVITAD